MRDAIWIIGVCAIWLGAANLFRRYRRTTRSYANWNAYKASMPAWARLFERVLLLIIFVPLAITILVILTRLSALFHPNRPTGSAAGAVIVFSSFLAAVAPAALIANGISWLIPQVREANLAAMKATDGVSFGSANRGLLLFAAVVTTLAFAQGLLASLV
ncbi:MAG: hypothetical protein JO208_11250 [Alphaproteobacteria bacterium]|nr:hypothetical protein [Alphaproteobacteria bacterium]